MQCTSGRTTCSAIDYAARQVAWLSAAITAWRQVSRTVALRQ
jgi:hypothetical protein